MSSSIKTFSHRMAKYASVSITLAQPVQYCDMSATAACERAPCMCVFSNVSDWAHSLRKSNRIVPKQLSSIRRMSLSKQHFKLFYQLQTTHIHTHTHTAHIYLLQLTKVYTAQYMHITFTQGRLRQIETFRTVYLCASIYFPFSCYWLKTFEHDKCNTWKM